MPLIGKFPNSPIDSPHGANVFFIAGIKALLVFNRLALLVTVACGTLLHLVRQFYLQLLVHSEYI